MGSSIDNEIKSLQQQLNFITGQITQNKNLVKAMENVIQNHETNRLRIEKELENAYKRKKENGR